MVIVIFPHYCLTVTIFLLYASDLAFLGLSYPCWSLKIFTYFLHLSSCVYLPLLTYSHFSLLRLGYSFKLYKTSLSDFSCIIGLSIVVNSGGVEGSRPLDFEMGFVGVRGVSKNIITSYNVQCTGL